MLSKTQKDTIFEEIKALLRDVDVPIVGSCLHRTIVGLHVLGKHEDIPRVVIQAGSMSWPRIKPEEDDGKCNTHFSYQFEATNEQLKAKLDVAAANKHRRDFFLALPEIHVWLGIPETQELIDFSTENLPSTCCFTLGETWTAPKPPPYLWTDNEGMPLGVHYKANMYATSFIYTLISILSGDPIGQFQNVLKSLRKPNREN